MIRRPSSSGSRAWSSRPEPKSPEEEVSLPAALSVPLAATGGGENGAHASAKRAHPSRAFSGEVSPQRTGGTAFLIFFTPGRHPATVSDSGCPTAAVFSKPARLYSFPRAIGPTDETPPETSQPPYGKASVRRPEPRAKVHNKRDVPCTGASLVLLSAVSRPLASSPPERLGKDGSRKAPFSCAGQGGLLRGSFFYDVGGTMGSPYIFQVSGR